MCTKKSEGFGRVIEASKPSKTKKKLSETLVFKCPICLDRIKDASNDTTGEDEIACEGRCNKWLHRRCSGLSKAAYEPATSSSSPFYCPHCRLDSHESESASLKCMINKLVEDVYSLLVRNYIV